MDWMDLATQLEPTLNKGNLAECVLKVEEEIKKCSKSPFHLILQSDFTNMPKDIAEHFEKFIRSESDKFDLKAIYVETNGFDINPDCWFFDIFGFENYGGSEDYDWISDWQSGDYPRLVLTGMEKMQEVYASDDFNNDDYSDVIGLTSLLIVFKFQMLIQKAAPLISNLKCPIVATGHDYDIFYEVNK
jgi:hypothetical protein